MLSERMIEVLASCEREFGAGEHAAIKSLGRLAFITAADAIFDEKQDCTFIDEIAERVSKYPIGKNFKKAMRLLLGDAEQESTRTRGAVEIPCRVFCLPEEANMIKVVKGKKTFVMIEDRERAKRALQRARQEARGWLSRGHWLLDTLKNAKQAKQEKNLTLADVQDNIANMRKKALNMASPIREEVLNAMTAYQSALESIETKYM